MVLVTVLMVVIVLSIFVTSILSQQMSQGFSSQDRINQIKAQELAQGAFWKAYGDMIAGSGPSVNSEVMDGKTYTVSVAAQPANSTVPYNVSVTY